MRAQGNPGSLNRYRAQQTAEKADRRRRYQERLDAATEGLREATGLTLHANDAIGGIWVSLADAEAWLAERGSE